ncbi:MAG: sigma-70 family RNA polymerase sigma factor [Alteromonadaceae bacterium]|nr:sigma-70 family RNA polymerase sigma factor [Alteromonadaceae bacterium]
MEQAQIDLWVLEAKQGDKNAFTHLCRHFHPNLLRFSYKLSTNEHLAHDAVQNSWLKITRSITRIEDPRAFRSWIYRSVRWETYDLLRKNKRLDEKQIVDDVDNFCATEPEQNDTWETGDLLNHISTLPDIDKQSIHLFYLEQMSLQEISIVLEVPVGTIKSRLNRARKILKQRLTSESQSKS